MTFNPPIDPAVLKIIMDTALAVGYKRGFEECQQQSKVVLASNDPARHVILEELTTIKSRQRLTGHDKSKRAMLHRLLDRLGVKYTL